MLSHQLPAQKKKPLVPPPPIGRPPVAAPTPIAAKPDPYAGMPPDLAAQMRGMDKRGTVAKAQAAATKGTVRGNNVQGAAPAPAAIHPI